MESEKKVYNLWTYYAKFDPNQKLKLMYQGMKARNKKKFSTDIPFSFIEFEYWATANDYLDMYDFYKESEFSKWESPSVDRINNSKGYTFDNMRLITFRENSIKGLVENPRQNFREYIKNETKQQRFKRTRHMSNKLKENGYYKKASKPIYMFKNGELIMYFRSREECVKMLPFLQRPNISKVIRGERPHHKGFTFRCCPRGD